MFKNLFDFSRQRTLKESVGFYVFYCALFLGVSGLVELLAG